MAGPGSPDFVAWRIIWIATACIALPVSADGLSPPHISDRKGYLARDDVPVSAELLPPPPARGSPQEGRDRQASRAAMTADDDARWQIAVADADLSGPKATGAMACAAGFEISPRATPAIDRLLRRSVVDFGAATASAKVKYQRARPFMVNGLPQCTPQSEDRLRRDGSYPSGHSAAGYGWSLILAELVPERAAGLIARGRAFGDSRRYCNVHWLSDIEAGRTVARAVVLRLHDVPEFLEDLAAARKEAISASSVPPQRSCTEEAATLSAQ